MTISRQQKSATLKKVPLFANLNEEDSNMLADHVTEEVLQTDTTVFTQGNVGDALYIIETGEIEIFIHEAHGEKVILSTATPGDFFGELSLLDSGPRTASARTTMATKVLVLNQENMNLFLHKRPAVMLDLMKVVIERLRNATAIIQERSVKNSNQIIETKLSLFQRIALRTATTMGTVPFLVINLLAVLLWLIPNAEIIDGVVAFDPYPFPGLCFLVAIESIFLSIVVLCGQTVQGAATKIRNDIEFEANLNSELAVRNLHTRIGSLHDEIVSRLHGIEKRLPKAS